MRENDEPRAKRGEELKPITCASLMIRRTARGPKIIQEAPIFKVYEAAGRR
jgi:hypothetical protein